MKQVLAYDLPTRAFHLLFGLLFIVSFGIGKFVDDESTLYAYHMLSGLTMAFMVIMRLIWGVVGTQYAKFNSFKLKPQDLVVYFKNVLSGKTKRELGHNPASSYAAIFMFLLTFALVGTGLFMVNGIGKEFFEEIHELFGLAFLLTVIFHIAGVIFHQVRHRDGMIFSMFTGNKDQVDGQLPITQQAPIALVLFLVLSLGFAINLLNHFDAQNGTLTLMGKNLQLGEKENEHSVDYYNKYYDHEDKDDD